ncbi:uncharacterized protein LOC132734020 [Ruditapes philippinarum]|uniref:uncharacterized protein LOC132734020 n=1 Tax=Ruditapes philippinarum TaxID=129788 RepID=UPI00295C182A|nr:uncharacterized protein LOC132734020 [Ruditapes philippinarum]
MIRLVLITVISIFLLVDSAKAVLVCYRWTEEDIKAMVPSRTTETERKQCEDVLGYTYSPDYSKCGGCSCCQPQVLVCHKWTEEDDKAMGSNRAPEDEKKYCESVLGYTWTQGDNAKYPECGECWCCKPKS